MKKFIFRVNLFLTPILLLLLVIVCAVDGYSDPFYLRFTTPKQSSLIVGTSRAAQGILPQILNQHLNRNDFYNYAFTRNDSPYGPVYFNSIRQKINPNTKNGIFILAVDAWSISSDSKNPNDTINFEERNSFIANIKQVNSNPNIAYLSNFYQNPLGHLFSSDKSMLLHDDGWLEVSVDIRSIAEKDIALKVQNYRSEVLPHYHYSPARFSYLVKTVEYLKPFGKVYLVQLPMHPLMMQIDQELVPDIDQKMQDLSARHQVPYLNLTSKNSQFQYTDGNHLYKDSGKKVSREIANWILLQ